MPMSLAAESMPDDPRLQAFLYGPLVLAGDLGTEGLREDLIVNRQGPDAGKIPMSVPELRASGSKLEDWIKQDGPLAFRGGGVTMKPLNQLWGRYATYWNVS
jgi:hypothetical protein